MNKDEFQVGVIISVNLCSSFTTLNKHSGLPNLREDKEILEFIKFFKEEVEKIKLPDHFDTITFSKRDVDIRANLLTGKKTFG